jgi:hypothetical protein
MEFMHACFVETSCHSDRCFALRPQGSVIGMSDGAPTRISKPSEHKLWEQKYPALGGAAPSSVVRVRPASSTAALRSGTRKAAPAARSQFSGGGSPVKAAPKPEVKEGAAPASTTANLATYPARPPRDGERQPAPPPLDFSQASIIPGVAAAPRPELAPLRVPLPLSVASTHGAAAAGGYEHLELAIARMHERLDDVPLDQRWQAIAAWLDRYSVDRSVEALVQNAAALHRDVAAFTHGKARPCYSRTAVSFMLMEQVLNIVTFALPALLPLAEAVTADMQDAVYMAAPNSLTLSRSFEALCDEPLVAGEQAQRLIERFYNKTYYQCVREVSTKLLGSRSVFEEAQQTKEKQMAVMNRIVAYWQRYTLGTLFRGWRGYIGGRKANSHKKKEEHRAQKLIHELRSKVALADASTTKDLLASNRNGERLAAEVKAARAELQRQQDAHAELQAEHRALKDSLANNSKVRRLMKEIKTLRASLADATARRSRRGSLQSSGPPGAGEGRHSSVSPAADGDAMNASGVSGCDFDELEDDDETATVAALRQELAEANEKIVELQLRVT